jgi:hypothetical protein
MSYDQFDNPESDKKQNQSDFVKAGTHELEIVEVQDKESEKDGIECYRIHMTVVSSVGLDGGPGPHVPGERVKTLYKHGKGSNGYAPKTGISYGDRDFKEFLVSLAKSAGLDPAVISENRQWSAMSKNVIGPAQAARGMRVVVKNTLRDAYAKTDARTGAKIPPPIDPDTGKVKQFLQTSWHPVPGQESFRAELLNTSGQISSSAPTAPPSAPATPGAPTPPRPPAPPAAEHPMADEVRKQAAGWAASGQTAEAAINGLLGWAVGLGLTDAQARAAIKSQF